MTTISTFSRNDRCLAPHPRRRNVWSAPTDGILLVRTGGINTINGVECRRSLR
jgi:hypothetical protein